MQNLLFSFYKLLLYYHKQKTLRFPPTDDCFVYISLEAHTFRVCPLRQSRLAQSVSSAPSVLRSLPQI